jgi:hypothetical protein
MTSRTNRPRQLTQYWRATVALLGAALAVSAASYDYEKMWSARSTENARLLGRLEKLEPTNVYLLDGGPKRAPRGETAQFHDTPVLAVGTLADQSARRQFTASLRRVLESGHGGQPACFFPRHGVTLIDGPRRYDIVMCFECNRFDVYDGDGNGLYSSGFAAEESAVWDALFSAAGVKVTAATRSN